MTKYKSIHAALYVFLILAIVTSVNAQTALPSFQIPSNTTEPETQDNSKIQREIKAAKNKAESTKKKYESDLRLYRKGASSRKDVLKSLYEMRVAKLELMSMRATEFEMTADDKKRFQRGIQVDLCEAKLKYAKSCHEISTRLYRKGSGTKREYKRTSVALNVAELELKRAKLYTSNLSNHEIKKRVASTYVEENEVRFDFAKYELELFNRLFQRDGASKLDVQRAYYMAKVARLNLDGAKINASNLSETEKEFKRLDISLAKVTAKSNHLNSIHVISQKLFNSGQITQQELTRSREAAEKAAAELEAAKKAAKAEVDT